MSTPTKAILAIGTVLLGGVFLFMVLVTIPVANKARSTVGYRTANESKAALRRNPKDIQGHIGLAEDAWRNRNYAAAT